MKIDKDPAYITAGFPAGRTTGAPLTLHIDSLDHLTDRFSFPCSANHRRCRAPHAEMSPTTLHRVRPCSLSVYSACSGTLGYGRSAWQQRMAVSLAYEIGQMGHLDDASFCADPEGASTAEEVLARCQVG